MITATLAVVLGFLAGCSDDTCRRDFDCPEKQVCEPNGCAKACETRADCPAPLTCHVRRAEEGRACRLARPDE